jgi:micrococcal nuclease
VSCLLFIIVRGVLLLLTLTLVACSSRSVDLSRQSPATLADEPPGYEQAEVERVVDGDTLVVSITDRVDGPGAGEAHIGETYSLRMIGIDTPESVDPRREVECFGREAAAATKALLDGKQVLLVKDVEETDSFDRLLRYVYFGGEMANARLVINGYAGAYTHPPNVRHADLFVALQSEARANETGLWSPETCNGRGSSDR